ncbi:MAG: sigma-70 family RNA polymerase sigma factor [Phycisphaerae bacterium]|nr:sigma-70 family RNA polymerase sigma factor [Phycisphaerae bacterium]
MSEGHATQLLHQSRAGDAVAAAELFPLVYEQLRTLAQQQIARERLDHTLQATALVNEVYLKLVDQARAQVSDRNHFMSIAAEAMRRILVDHARTKRAEKRGGGRAKVALDTRIPLGDDDGQSIDLVELGDALDRLGEIDERARRVVELRFFAGFTKEETAEILGVSRATVGNDWAYARTWLRAELADRVGD